MKPRGTITLVFDDGYTEVAHHVIPLLAQYNVHAVFAVPVTPENGAIAGASVESVSRWKEITRTYRHELAAHGVHHRDLVSISESDLEEELKKSAQATETTTLVYPGGGYNERVVSVAKKYFTAARTVQFGLETIPPKRPYELRTINYTKKNFSVARANAYAVLAMAKNGWLIETFHMVSPEKSPVKHFVFLDDLRAHLDFITTLPLRIATIQEILE